MLNLECMLMTHISFAGNNIQNINTVLNEDLARVEKWLTANKLTLNASKTVDRIEAEAKHISQSSVTYD